MVFRMNRISIMGTPEQSTLVKLKISGCPRFYSGFIAIKIEPQNHEENVQCHIFSSQRINIKPIY